MKVLVIGAGLAGSEAANYLAQKGVKVVLVECKTKNLNPAQKIATFAELVCTNSLKSVKATTGHGLLKNELNALGSIVLDVARETAVDAGDALAVDRVLFSQGITNRILNHPNIELIEAEASDPLQMMNQFQCQYVIVASGPLTTNPLESWIKENIGEDDFYFYDAIAPVVDGDSLDYSKLYFKDRYQELSNDKADYLNAPFTKEQYEVFINELKIAEKVPAKDFEKLIYFEHCLPIDEMASRGPETARFSCMRPVGLEMANGVRPYAVIQLRKENLLGHAYNLVGLQTRLTYKEQVRIFRMIPGLENAQFIHLGSMHRNSFLNARKVLNSDLSCMKYPQLHFAGQITGVEGYTESAMIGLYVADQVWRKLQGNKSLTWPVETATGALINYLMTAQRSAPTNINFGLLPDLELTKIQRKNKDRKKIKKELIAERTINAFSSFFQEFFTKNLNINLSQNHIQNQMINELNCGLGVSG